MTIVPLTGCGFSPIVRTLLLVLELAASEVWAVFFRALYKALVILRLGPCIELEVAQ